MLCLLWILVSASDCTVHYAYLTNLYKDTRLLASRLPATQLMEQF